MALDYRNLQASVLGDLLISPELMGEAVLALREDDFNIPVCRMCWTAMVRMFREGQTVDIVLLCQSLSGVEGVQKFLAECMEITPTAANFQAHVKTLKEQAMLARLRDLGSQLAGCDDLGQALDLVAKGNDISIHRQARERRSMEQMLQSFAARHSANVTPEFLPWPIKPLNQGVKVTGGKFVVIGGYPSDGKTAFAIQSAMVQAGARQKTAFYSFETDANTVEDRALACMAGISMESIQSNTLSDSDWTAWAKSGEAYATPFDVIAASGMTVDDIRADALAHRYSVIYIDYLQLITPGRRNSIFSRFDEVSEISRSLQQLAKTTGITVVALSQMTRPAADKKGNVPPPTMHNLRESGQIEQDADVIMLIYRLDHKDIRAPRYLDVAKNKEGRTGHWCVNFDGQYQRFTMDSRQDPPPAMPPAHRRPRPTPVLSRQEDYQILEGQDALFPF